jgi:serpin B
MRHAVREGAALLLLIAMVAGCAGASVAPTTPPPSARPVVPDVSLEPFSIGLAKATVARVSADPADAKLAADAINDFGLQLLRDAVERDENAVLSPASIAMALAMARAGARGDTAAEMDTVLRGVASDGNPTWLNALDAALGARSGTFRNQFNKDADVLLRIANQAFAQGGFAFEQSYLDALASRYGAGLWLVDFVNDAEAARRTANQWVADQTEQRIPELLGDGAVDTLTRLVLINAVYLKSAWFAPFSGTTAPAPFHRLDGSTVDVQMMHTLAELPYAKGSGYEAVELPYAGRQLAMLVIVPDDLAAFEAGLDGQALAAITDGLHAERVAVAFPRFGIETKLDLNRALAAMGMPLAFDERRADFSGITPAADLYISGVIHQANIDVDEEGTEASAATAVIMGTTSMPPPPIPMTVDRPFLFALRDVQTGAILFLGRVVEPMERN